MKESLTNWDNTIENIVVRIKELRSEGAPPEDVVKGLTALKALGCKIGIGGSAGGRKYLRVRWSGKGERKEVKAGPVDYEMRKTLKKAGLYLEATASSD